MPTLVSDRDRDASFLSIPAQQHQLQLRPAWSISTYSTMHDIDTNILRVRTACPRSSGTPGLEVLHSKHHPSPKRHSIYISTWSFILLHPVLTSITLYISVYSMLSDRLAVPLASGAKHVPTRLEPTQPTKLEN